MQPSYVQYNCIKKHDQGCLQLGEEKKNTEK